MFSAVTRGVMEDSLRDYNHRGACRGVFLLGSVGASPPFVDWCVPWASRPRSLYCSARRFRMMAEAMWIGLLERSGAVHYLRNASSIHSLLCIHVVFVRGVC
jgi:hypothetical protein